MSLKKIAVPRNVPKYPVKFEVDPYGFIEKWQAIYEGERRGILECAPEHYLEPLAWPEELDWGRHTPFFDDFLPISVGQIECLRWQAIEGWVYGKWSLFGRFLPRQTCFLCAFSFNDAVNRNGVFLGCPTVGLLLMNNNLPALFFRQTYPTTSPAECWFFLEWDTRDFYLTQCCFSYLRTLISWTRSQRIVRPWSIRTIVLCSIYNRMGFCLGTGPNRRAFIGPTLLFLFCPILNTSTVIYDVLTK